MTETNQNKFIVAFFEGVLFLVAMILGQLFGLPLSTQFAFEQKDFWLGILAAIPLLVLVLMLFRLNWQPIQNVRRYLERHVLPFFADWSWWQLAILSILAGIGEECLFRGFIQGKLTQAGGVVLGIMGTSVLFGVVHLVTNTYGIIAALIGLYLGVLQVWSQNLLLPITTHAVYDFVVLLLLVRNKEKLSRIHV